MIEGNELNNRMTNETTEMMVEDIKSEFKVFRDPTFKEFI